VGVTLRRERITKIGEHAIAHVSSDLAMVAGDDLTDAGVVRRRNPPHVLWVQPRRKCRRANQIAEHNRQVALLGLIWSLGLGRWFGCYRSGLLKFRDGAKHVTAMPGEHTEVLEILLR